MLRMKGGIRTIFEPGLIGGSALVPTWFWLFLSSATGVVGSFMKHGVSIANQAFLSGTWSSVTMPPWPTPTRRLKSHCQFLARTDR